MFNKLTKNILLLFILFSVGCTERVTVEEIVSTAWSDTSLQIAFYELRYTEVTTTGDSSPSIENIEYRLGTIDRNGEAKQYYTDYFRRYGREYFNSLSINNKALQFKSNSGFVLARVGDSGRYYLDNTIYTAERDYIVYDLNGNVLHQISKDPAQYCGAAAAPDTDMIRALASPNGTLIVKVESTTDCELEVSFLDPSDDFNVTETKRITGQFIGGLVWVNDNNLLIHACDRISCNESWILVRAGQVDAIPVTDEEFSNLCLAGAIFRTDINDIGELIKWDSPQTGVLVEEANQDHYKESELTTLGNRTVRMPDNPDGCISIETIML